MTSTIRAIRSLVAAALAATAAACGDGVGAAAAKPSEGPRIVSLSPALTHSIERLGGGGTIVGCTPWCRVDGAAVVGALEDRNLEAIAALRPTLLVRQSASPDPALDRVLAGIGAKGECWTLATLGDVRGFVPQLAAALESAGIAGATERAEDIAAEHRAAIAERVSTDGPVVFLYATDPPAAFGAGSYVDELWRAMGGRNAVSSPGYPALTAEDVANLGAVAVVVIGPSDPPAWMSVAAPVRISVDAPELLEPGADMLTAGPASLRAVDRRIREAGAR